MQLAARIALVAALMACIAGAARAAGPQHVDITWLSISNMHFDVGSQRILADGYITRLPQQMFSGGASGFATTRQPLRSDTEAVRRVLTALGGARAVNVLITGHNHFDHTFDTATWAMLSGARVIGSPTTCLQTGAAGIAAERCAPVYGGERFALGDGVAMYVIRWNHSGSSATVPELHQPLELREPPRPDTNGAWRAGVTEDFPNGGGNRAYLFTVDGPRGRFSWLYQDSGGHVDLHAPLVVEGVNYGAPLENLRAAMKHAGVASVDLWIATGGRALAELVVPVARPKAYLPVHWDDFWAPFAAGVTRPWSDPELRGFLVKEGVRLIVPSQYMDRWRLDAAGITAVPNAAVKHALGFQ